MHLVVVIYLWLSILLYLVLGGADFGAGIIELLTTRRRRKRFSKTVYHTIGPVWEANHMWLIIAIVILFVGFPEIYSLLSIHLHIPMLIMLMGIIARGTSFAFRYYDAVNDHMQKWYNRLFVSSSFITPLFLGIIAGSTLSGKIDPTGNTYLESYVYSWLNWFSVAVGFFTVALCAYLASVFLVGEADAYEDKQRFIRAAKTSGIASVVLGGLVFMTASIENVPLAQWVFGDPVGLGSVIAASISLVLLWFSLDRGKTNRARILAGFQVTMILLAASYHNFPDFVIVHDGQHLSLLDAPSSPKAISVLGWTLLTGSLFILPALFYLFYSFEKTHSAHTASTEA